MAAVGGARPKTTGRQVSGSPSSLSSTPPGSLSSRTPPKTGHGQGPTRPVASGSARTPKSPSNDIGRIVEAYRSFQTLSWPIKMCFEFITSVLCWEYPILTIAIWFSLQVFCVYITAGQLLIVGMMCLVAIAILGYISYTNKQLMQSNFSSADKRQQIVNLVSPTSSSPSSASSGDSATKSKVTGQTTSNIPVQDNHRSKPVSSAASSSSSSTAPAAVQGPASSSTTSTSSSPPASIFSASEAGCQATRNADAKLQQDNQRRKELLAEYRQMMQDLSGWLSTASRLLQELEDILLWQQWMKTVLFYFILSGGLVCITYLPIRWTAVAAVNCTFGVNPYCYATMLVMKDFVRSKMAAKIPNDEAENPVNSVQPKAPQEPHLQKDGPVSMHPLSDDRNSSEDNEDPAQDTKGAYSTAQPVTKGNSQELAGSKNSNPNPKKFESGNCYLCGTPFTSVLKRRRYCRYCGRDFCPKCCSRKLPRSVLGATAPAAQTEKELVCNLCVIKLTGEESATLR
ncbi:uncharacterized protein [Diadema setosum]|uniref:uncharacterized protein n=1 Tax=Diadema setosum TaxID=31175 RepID=UPI003B3ACC24